MDAVFYLKATPPKGVFGPEVKQVALDPVAMGLGCGGADAYCSTAYSSMWSALGGAGNVIPALRKKYGVTGRVAFVGFSAAHGFLNPLLNSESPDAVVLLDATFGGGKNGYVRAAKSAAEGGPLFAVATSDKGTTDALNNGDFAFREFVLEPAGLLSMPTATAVAPAPAPKGGVSRKGNLWYYRYADAQVHHWEMGKIMSPFLRGTLAPYWSGTLPLSSRPFWFSALAALAAAAATVWTVTRIAKGRERQDEEA